MFRFHDKLLYFTSSVKQIKTHNLKYSGDTNKGAWMDWDGVNWVVNTGRRSLNTKCYYEYQDIRGVASYPFHTSPPPPRIKVTMLMVLSEYHMDLFEVKNNIII